MTAAAPNPALEPTGLSFAVHRERRCAGGSAPPRSDWRIGKGCVKTEYTAVIKKSGKWWVGRIEEV